MTRATRTTDTPAMAVANAVSKIASGAAWRAANDPLARSISDLEVEGHAELVAALERMQDAPRPEARP